jgi:threonine dehydrogenase-like Zn-dependent dehydrogenase
MRGLLIADGRLSLENSLPEPRVAPGESLVQVKLAGICATDLALARGYMGFRGIPGHEFVGVALDGPLAGQRVVGEINAGCGTCWECRGGDSRHCSGRSVLGILGRPGAFAERLSLPVRNLLPIPADVGDAMAVFAEPLAAALALKEPAQAALSGAGPEACALVIGDGRLGLLCARDAGRAGLRVPGGRHLGQPLGPGPALRRYPLVIEASGQSQALPWSLAWTQPRGTLILKTTSEQPVAMDWSPVVIDELTIRGSRCGRLGDALAWMQSGRFDPQALIAARLSLERGPEAFELARRGGLLKILVDLSR